MGSVGTQTSVMPVKREIQTDGKYGRPIRPFSDSVEQLIERGFRAVNDFSLGVLTNGNPDVYEDPEPWNNRTRYYVWDEDFKRWIQVAEWRY